MMSRKNYPDLSSRVFHVYCLWQAVFGHIVVWGHRKRQREIEWATSGADLAILPATATLPAAFMIAQIPTRHDIVGNALVMIVISVHKRPRPGGMGDETNSNAPALRLREEKGDAVGWRLAARLSENESAWSAGTR